MKNKILFALLLVCATAAPFLSSAQGFIGNGTSTGIKAVNSGGGLTGVNVGIGLATPAAGTTLEVADPAAGPLGLRFDALPATTTPYLLYYDGSSVVTYGSATAASISSVDYDCGVGTVTVNGVTSANKAWLLSGSTTTSADYFGTFNNDNIRINTNNANCAFDQQKQRMLITAGSSPGNVSIGMWDGSSNPTVPQNKLLVENGNILPSLYSTIPINPADIGILSVSNSVLDNNNVAILGTVIQDNGLLNVGVVGSVGGNSSFNAAILANVLGDNSANQGMNQTVDGNGSSTTNFGIFTQVGTASSSNPLSTGMFAEVGNSSIISSNNNTGIQLAVKGSSSINRGVNMHISQDNASSNLGVGASVSGDNTNNNTAMYADVSGNNSSGTNTGFTSSVSGSTSQSTGMSTTVTGTSTIGNIGVASTVTSSGTTGSYFGVLATTVSNSNSSIGVQGTASGTTTSGNWGVYGKAFSQNNKNYGTAGFATDGIQSNTGAHGDARGDGLSDGNHGVSGYANGDNTTNYGVMGYIHDMSGSNANSINAGVYGSIYTTAAGLENYGVEGDLSGVAAPSSGNTKPYFAIYGIAPSHAGSGSGGVVSGANSNNSYAGYFDGDVFCSSTYYYSDPKLKENINDYKGALDKLKLLPVKSYTFRQKEFPTMNFPAGDQVGVLSTDLKKIFPNLIKQSAQPAIQGRGELVAYEAVNYDALIPVLIQAVKELDEKPQDKELAKKIEAQQAQLAAQSQQIADQSKQIADLRNMLDDLCANGCAGFSPKGSVSPVPVSGAALYQSVPNPASGAVSIGYAINMPYATASLKVITMDNKSVADYKITGQGNGTISIDTNSLAGGVYKYYLTIDGKIIDTKSMAITSK